MITQQVLSYMFYLWLKLGNSKFEHLRDFVVLPPKRTLLQLMKSRLPNGSGYKVEFYEAVSDKLGDIVQKDSDWLGDESLLGCHRKPEVLLVLQGRLSRGV